MRARQASDLADAPLYVNRWRWSGKLHRGLGIPAESLIKQAT
jgi:hypothetical protein